MLDGGVGEWKIETPNISILEFYLVEVEEIDRWNENSQSYGVGVNYKRAKEEAFKGIPGKDWNNITKIWKYVNGKWYQLNIEDFEGGKNEKS